MRASPESLLALAKKALAASPAPQTEVWASAVSDAWVRFAAGTVTTSGAVERTSLAVTATFGTRSGTATTEDVGPDGIAKAARTAADLARLLPPSPERLPPVAAQRYVTVPAWDEAAASSAASDRAARAGVALTVAREAGLVGAGFHRVTERATAFATSAGAGGVHRGTECSFECTMRTPDGAQSGWAGAYGHRLVSIDAAAVARRAADKAARWKEPVALPSGRYTAVLEPAAVEPMLGYLFRALDRRSADEGRSAFAAPGGKTRIGETLFSERLSLGCDPADRRIPGSPFAEDGLASRKLVVVENGKLLALPVSRYWAKEKKLPVSAESGNWSLVVDAPEPRGLEGLIASTERGILVTRIWYVRMLSPQNLTVTGLTRDATFLIENGEVTRPLKNFRVNQSLLSLLGNVEGATDPEPFPAGHVWYGIPAMKVRDVVFSSASDAV